MKENRKETLAGVALPRRGENQDAIFKEPGVDEFALEPRCERLFDIHRPRDQFVQSRRAVDQHLRLLLAFLRRPVSGCGRWFRWFVTIRHCPSTEARQRARDQNGHRFLVQHEDFLRRSILKHKPARQTCRATRSNAVRDYTDLRMAFTDPPEMPAIGVMRPAMSRRVR